jgi:hypothetical protein
MDDIPEFKNDAELDLFIKRQLGKFNAALNNALH